LQPRVHAVEKLKAGEVEKKPETVAKGLINNPERREKEGEDPVGVGRKTPLELGEGGAQAMEELSQDGEEGTLGASEERAGEGEHREQDVAEEEVEGGEEGPEEEAEEGATQVRPHLQHVQQPGEQDGNGGKGPLAECLGKTLLKGRKWGCRGRGGGEETASRVSQGSGDHLFG